MDSSITYLERLSIRSTKKHRRFPEDDLDFSSATVSTAAHDNVTQRKSPPKRAVRFDSVDTREYEISIDINPSVSSGPAVGLGWAHCSLPTISIDEFESKRQVARRSKNDCQMSRYRREDLLREFGYCRSEVDKAVEEINKLKRQRQASLAAQKFEKACIAKERALKKLRKLTGQYQKEQKVLWENVARIVPE